jgi:hypothetical protein
MKINVRKPGTRELLFFFCLFFFSTALTLKTNQGRGVYNWQSQIWSDKAGYYMYLPATFLYHFETSKCPEGIDEKTGYGFTVDRKNNTISTQYFYGVSLLVSPFFLSAHVISKISGQDELGGFSEIFQRFTEISGVFYLILGLFFLKKFIRNYFRESLQYFIILVTFLGTNLFYYAIKDNLMSHVYSFFAISLFLFAMKEFLADQTRYRYFLLMSVAFGLMFVIRPTNCLVGIAFLFWDSTNKKEIMTRLRLIFLPKYLFPLLGIMFLFMLPQMMYWKMVHGTFIYLKYGEKFVNWNNPKLLEVWFSTLNGLIPWSPVVLLFFISMLFMIMKKINNGILILVFFLLISYMAASYRYWYFGCGYGHRAFVEFYPLFCIPFGFLTEKLFARQGRIIKVIFSLLVLFVIYMNVGLSICADKCNFCSTWDWNQYSRSLHRIHLYPGPTRQFVFKNDFENGALSNGNKVTDSISNSRNWCAVLDKDNETCCEHTAMVWDFGGQFPKFMNVRLSVRKVKSGPVNAFLVCSFEKNDSVRIMQLQRLDPFVRDNLSWFTVFKTFLVPDGLPGDTRLKIYVWNKERSSFFVDDLRIKYE